jgi:acyl-CoA synthetase (NDP forming)
MNKTDSDNRMEAFFKPRSIAAIGSLREALGTAYWLIRNLRQFGFQGPIYPVNPNPAGYGEVFGSKVFGQVTEVPDPIDLAVLLTPPEATPETIDRCAAKGVKAAIILSEGFAETGGEGAELQRQLKAIALRTGIRIMGPLSRPRSRTSDQRRHFFVQSDRLDRPSPDACR